MRKKLIILIILLIAFSVYSFSQIPDNVNLETQEPNEIFNATAYENNITNLEDIILDGNDVLTIKGSHYSHMGNIILKGDSELRIINSLIEHNKDFSAQFSLEAHDNSKVIIEDSIIKNDCTGTFNWNFFDNSRLVQNNVVEEPCNIWRLITNNASAEIRNSTFSGGGLTVCDNAKAVLENSNDVEFELCYGDGVNLDLTLPSEIDEFIFPPEFSNIDTSIIIRNSSVDGWGLGVTPNSHITLRDTEKATISIIVGLPLENEVVILDDLGRKYYGSRSWEIGSGELNILNSTIYGWEANVFAKNNTLIVRNSNFTGATINSDHSREIIENSTMDIVHGHENVYIEVKDSIINGDVIASENSTILLFNTEVRGRIIEEDEGRVFN